MCRRRVALVARMAAATSRLNAAPDFGELTTVANMLRPASAASATSSRSSCCARTRPFACE